MAAPQRLIAKRSPWARPVRGTLRVSHPPRSKGGARVSEMIPRGVQPGRLSARSTLTSQITRAKVALRSLLFLTSSSGRLLQTQKPSLHFPHGELCPDVYREGVWRRQGLGKKQDIGR